VTRLDAPSTGCSGSSVVANADFQVAAQHDLSSPKRHPSALRLGMIVAHAYLDPMWSVGPFFRETRRSACTSLTGGPSDFGQL